MKAETEPIVVPIKVDFPDDKKLIAVANQALKVASAWHVLALEPSMSGGDEAVD